MIISENGKKVIIDNDHLSELFSKWNNGCVTADYILNQLFTEFRLAQEEHLLKITVSVKESV